METTFNFTTIVGDFMVELLKVLFAGILVPTLMQVLNQLAQIWTKSLMKETKYVIHLSEGSYSFTDR